MSHRSDPTSPASRVLRIGLIQGGRVLEERLVRSAGPVTVGTHPGCTLVVADDTVGETRVLFERKDGAYWLKPDGTQGQVALDGKSSLDLAALPGEALADGALKLSDTSRGRVKLGDDLLVLFHFVQAPKATPGPSLPASARRGWVKQIEPVFTSVLTLSFLAHAVMTVLVFQVEPPPPVDQSRVLAMIERLMPPAVEVRVLPNEVKLTPPKTHPRTDRAQAKTASAEPAAKPRGDRRPGKTRGQVADEVRDAAKDYLAMIGTIGDSGSGTSELMDISDGLGTFSTTVSGKGVSSGGRFGKRTSAGGGRDKGIDIGPPSLGDTTERRVTTRRDKRDQAELPPVIVTEEIEDIEGDIDRRVVVRRLKAKSGAFQACYERVLKTQPKLAGKLGLEIVIGDGGRVGSVEVVNDRLGSPAVASCVKRTARRVRMPAPKDGDVVIAYTLVFSPR